MAGMEEYFGPRKGKHETNSEEYDSVSVARSDIGFSVNASDDSYLRWDDRSSLRSSLHLQNLPLHDDRDIRIQAPRIPSPAGYMDGISDEAKQNLRLDKDSVRNFQNLQLHDRNVRIQPPYPTRFLDGFTDEDALICKYIKTGVGVATLITENLLSHPFLVLRRQCQVHNCSSRYHLLPVTLLPVMLRLNQRQGITTLWKGLGSVLLVRGMTLAIEDVISKFTPWPKEFKWHNSLKSHGQHLMLKCLTLAIITPFHSASLVETVQSDIASEKPGVFDVFREGICRLVSWGNPQKGRMLPVWNLVVPTVVFGILKYLFSIFVDNATSRVLQLSNEMKRRKEGALPKLHSNQAGTRYQDIETTARFAALIASETLFYPLETILHRLHLQGTRTIIDNLDTGTHVIPILTNYEGAIDCYVTSLKEEGDCGLFKGFGALVLQFAAHVLVIKLTKVVLMRAAQIFCGNTVPHEPDPRLQKPQQKSLNVIQPKNTSDLKFDSDY